MTQLLRVTECIPVVSQRLLWHRTRLADQSGAPVQASGPLCSEVDQQTEKGQTQLVSSEVWSWGKKRLDLNLNWQRKAKSTLTLGKALSHCDLQDLRFMWTSYTKCTNVHVPSMIVCSLVSTLLQNFQCCTLINGLQWVTLKSWKWARDRASMVVHNKPRQQFSRRLRSRLKGKPLHN